jgi:hypothetical protein
MSPTGSALDNSLFDLHYGLVRMGRIRAEALAAAVHVPYSSHVTILLGPANGDAAGAVEKVRPQQAAGQTSGPAQPRMRPVWSAVTGPGGWQTASVGQQDSSLSPRGLGRHQPEQPSAGRSSPQDQPLSLGSGGNTRRKPVADLLQHAHVIHDREGGGSRLAGAVATPANVEPTAHRSTTCDLGLAAHRRRAHVAREHSRQWRQAKICRKYGRRSLVRGTGVDDTCQVRLRGRATKRRCSSHPVKQMTAGLRPRRYTDTGVRVRMISALKGRWPGNTSPHPA